MFYVMQAYVLFTGFSTTPSPHATLRFPYLQARSLVRH